MRIRKGTHSDFRLPRLWFGRRTVTRTVTFAENCLYDVGSNHWNKLFGFGYGLDHHQNSVRIGWRGCNGIIEIGAYSYVAGVRCYPIATVQFKPGIPVTLRLEMGFGWTRVYAGGILLETIGVGGTWGVLLGLYYGGVPVAPHDMDIEMV